MLEISSFANWLNVMAVILKNWRSDLNLGLRRNLEEIRTDPMPLRIVNLAAIAASLFVALTFFAGVLSSANAFFCALSIVTVYTGYQLTLRDGMPLIGTLKNIVTRPSEHPRRGAYLAYVGSLAVGGAVVLQSLTTGI
jgi:hypothetical protein